MQINWGIIGCGDVCEVKSGPAFNKVSNSKLVAVMRRNAAKAKDFATRHGVPKFYSDADELINDSAVNAIYIATPPSSHELYLEKCLQAGKPVYVEKPVTINAASLERMIGFEKIYGSKVSVAHYRRSLPLFIKVRDLISTGVIGKVKLVLLQTLQPVSKNVIPEVEENWRVNTAISGGGLFHDLSPHQLDIMYWLFGVPLKSNVMVANQGQHYNAPDSTLVQLQFANDIHFGFFGSANIEITTADKIEIQEVYLPEHIQQPHIENVVKFFRGELQNPCSLQDALVTMQVMDKAIG